MKIKNLFTIILVLMASFTASFAADDGSAIIDANLLSQTPDPAKAGDTVELRFSIENIGWDTSDYLTASIEEGFPFTVIGENQVNVGKLLNGQNDDYKQIISFDVKIDSETKAGTHDLTLIITDTRGNNNEYDFTIDVESEDSVEILSIDKSIIKPGSQEELKFKIKNVGTANLENLKFSLTSEDNVLLPVSADNTFHIDSLVIGEEIEVVFDVIASTSITSDLYSLSLKLAYEDSLTGTNKEVTTTAGIYIGGSTEFDIVFDEEADGEYAFTIANVGSNDATSVKVTVQDSSSWKVSSRSSEIIGNLNSGDYTTTSFDMTTTKGGDLNFEVEYTDTMGVRQIVIKQVEMSDSLNGNSTMSGNRPNMASGDGVQAGQNRGPFGGLTTAGAGLASLAKNLGIALIIIIAGIFGFKYYRRRKSSKK